MSTPTVAAPQSESGTTMTPNRLISIVLPVYNEGENIQVCLGRISQALKGYDHEILVCYDFDEDTTLPAIDAMPDRPAGIRLVRNTIGRGVVNALKAGFATARGDVIVSTMADLSDPPQVIPEMARRIREGGADVVSGSRYMKGGRQMGGPFFKRTLSRVAGLSLYWIAGLRTHDATTNFRAYSVRFIRSVTVESASGFEVALELTAKAQLNGFKVDEVPSTWTDRSAGTSRFKLWKWLPGYLNWFFLALITPLICWATCLVTLGEFTRLGKTGPDTRTLVLVILASVASLLLARRIRGRMMAIDLLAPFAIQMMARPQPLRWTVGCGILAVWAGCLALDWRRIALGLIPAWRSPWRWAAAIAAMAAMIFVLAPPWLVTTLDNAGLDPSWIAFLHAAAERQDLVWGRDLQFTFGPLGYLEAPMYRPSTFVSLMTWSAVVWSVISLSICSLGRRVGLGASTTFMIFVCVLVLGRGPGYHGTILCTLLLALHFTGESRRPAIAAVLVALLMGIASTIKFSVCVPALAVIGFLAIDEIALCRRIPLLLSAYAIGFAGAWVWAGQPLAALPDYLKNGLEVTSGFADAMSIYHKREQALASLSLAAVLAAGSVWHAVRLGLMRRIAFALALTAMLFVVWKSGVVRLDSHIAHLRTTVPIALLLGVALMYGPVKSWRELLRWCAVLVVPIASWLAALAPFPGPGKMVSERITNFPTSTANAIRTATTADTGRPAQFEKAMARIRKQVPLDRVDGAVDIYPTQCAAVIAANLAYSPRPIFQSYSAYTAKLAQSNRLHLLSPAAPKHVFFSLGPIIGGRLPSMDDGLSWPELLTRYDLVGRSPRFLHLQLRANPLTYELIPLARQAIRWNEELDLSRWADSGPLWVRVHFSPTLFGRARTAAYKPPLVELRLTRANTASNEYRIIPGVADAGFLLSPVVATLDDLSLLYRGTGELSADDARRVRTIRFQLRRDLNQLEFEPQIDVELLQLRINR